MALWRANSYWTDGDNDDDIDMLFCATIMLVGASDDGYIDAAAVVVVDGRLAP